MEEMNEHVVTLDSGTALGGRLAWAHVGTTELSNVAFSIDGEFARMATAEPTHDTCVLGVDYDVVYVSYGDSIVRFQLIADGTVIAIDPVPATVDHLLEFHGEWLLPG